MFLKALAGFMVYTMAITQVIAQTATLVPNAKQTFLGTTGAPLAQGTVTYYVPGSTNKKTTWLDAYQASANTNPVVLDAAGRGVMFGQGNYRQVVKDKNGVQIWDSFTSAVGSSAPSGATGTDTAPVGTIVPYAGFTLPTNWQLTYGQTVSRTTFSDLKTAITIVDTAVSCINSSTTLTGFVSTAQMRVGAPIEATCISTGVTIATIVGPTSITISSAASATNVVTATVFPWGNGDGVSTFNVPDLRGRIIPGADAMGGIAANVLTSAFYGMSASPPAVAGGAQSRTVAQNQLPNVTLTANVNSTVTDILRNPSAVQVTPSGTGSGIGSGSSSVSGYGINSTGGTSSLNGGVTQQAIATIQPSLTMNYIIKVAPNTTGAGGVVSLGGMFGDIVCDSSLTCAPVASINTIGLSIAADSTILANVSGVSAQPTPTTQTQWLDHTCGSTVGSILMRDMTTWDCLTPGTSGFALVSQGPGLPLHYLATAGLGTVTSVGLSLPASILNVSGSPVTGAGTLSTTLAAQSAHAVFAGPISGSPAEPTFRALALADLPSGISTSYGSVFVYWNGSQWVYQKPDGTIVTAASSTCQIQEAITYGYGAGYGVIVYGQGSANPCAMIEQTISVPPGRGNNFLCLNCYWTFANTNHNGISFDNQQQCSWKMPGGSIFYSGDSSHIGILFSPQATVLGTKWSAWCDYDFGSVTANGGTPAALVYIDLPINNVSQVLASNFVNNRLHFNTLYGGNIAQYNFRYNTPAGANNAGGENWIHFTDNQDAALAEVSIGTSGGSPFDVNLGTNHYSGNIAHTTTNVSSAGIITDSSLDTFELAALNCYNSASGQNNVQWGASATNNVIQTKQAIACTGGLEGGTTQTFTLNNYFTGAWRPFTPTVTCVGGTVTASTSTGRALQLQPLSLSKSVSWSMDLALTTLASCTTSSGGAINATVPFTAQTGASGIGREIASTGNALIAQIGAGGTSYSINLSGNTCPDCVSGRHMILSGTVEVQ